MVIPIKSHTSAVFNSVLCGSTYSPTDSDLTYRRCCVTTVLQCIRAQRKFYIVYCHLLQCFTTGDAFTLICVYEHVHSYLFWFYFLYCDLLLCLTTRDAFTFDTCNWILLTYLLIQCEEFISELLMVSSETSKRTSTHPRTAVKRTNNLRFLTPQNPRMHGR